MQVNKIKLKTKSYTGDSPGSFQEKLWFFIDTNDIQLIRRIEKSIYESLNYGDKQYNENQIRI